MAGRSRLVIYVRTADSYGPRDKLTPSLGENFLKVGVGDADGDGKAEIYVVSGTALEPARPCTSGRPAPSVSSTA